MSRPLALAALLSLAGCTHPSRGPSEATDPELARALTERCAQRDDTRPLEGPGSMTERDLCEESVTTVWNEGPVGSLE